ncbi:MAG TPA: DMT family transporter [Burkholderiaceae bacterium]|nr:DMT family transporter [Burkholderiaceae bacterium]
MSPDRRRSLARFLLFVTPALWAANYVVARAAVGVIEPHALAFFRWLVALLVMLPIAWPALSRHWPAWRREWPQLLVLGALGMWICGAFVYIGARTTTGTDIGLIYAVSPVLIAVASAYWFGDRLSARQTVGLAVAVAGVLLILLKGSPAALLALHFTVGDLWVVAAASSWTVYSILLQAWRSVLDPFARLAAITFGGLLVLLPFTIAEAAVLGPSSFDPRSVGLILAAALLPGFAAYQAYSFMQKELGPARTGLVMYLGPPYAAAATWLLLGEVPAWYHWVGTALLLPGIWLATSRPRATRMPD